MAYHFYTLFSKSQCKTLKIAEYQCLFDLLRLLVSEVYNNEDVLPSLIESLKRKMDYNNVIGNKFDIDVCVYRYLVNFSYKDRNATYRLPLIFEWGKPQE